jgi:methylmalonyl-CoA mutase cobalamin-binding subunit
MTTENSNDDRVSADDGRTDMSALATAVLSALGDKSDDGSSTIRASVVRKLVGSTLRDGAFNAEMLLNDLKDRRVSPEQVVDIYIPEAARELGLMWVDDAIGFAKVTIATARLQGLLTLLAPPWSARAIEPAEGMNTLLILQANDSHTLGPHVATAQLRRLGASVRLLFGPDPDTIARVLKEETFHLIMFSCSRTDALATIAKLVKRVRSEMNGTPPIALGGIVLNLTDRIKEKTGVDLVTSDVRVAFRLCDNKRLKPRSVARV